MFPNSLKQPGRADRHRTHHRPVSPRTLGPGKGRRV